jgi:hypothetical protein
VQSPVSTSEYSLAVCVNPFKRGLVVTGRKFPNAGKTTPARSGPRLATHFPE